MSYKKQNFLPSSILLDKKWREHDYLLHQYRLHAIEGVPVERPNLNYQYFRSHSPPLTITASPYTRNQSAKTHKTKAVAILPKTSELKQRPQSSNIKPTYKESPYAVKKNNYVTRPKTSKQRETLVVRPDTSKRKTTSRPQTSKSPRVEPTWIPAGNNLTTRRHVDEESPRRRPVTSKQNTIVLSRPGTTKHRPSTSKPMTKNKATVRDQRLRLRATPFRPIKSEYSIEAMNKHFEKHQYLKNHILHRNKIVRPPTPEEEDKSDGYSSLFESSSEPSVVSDPEHSPPPSITPSPPPSGEAFSQTPLFEDDNIDVAPTPLPPPLFKELEDLDENFIPPSTIYKVDKEASQSSESDENPVLIVKDGKTGTYKRKPNGDYVLIDEKKRKKKLRKKLLEKQRQKAEKIKNEDEDDDGEEKPKPEIYYIDYQNMRSDDDESDVANDADDEDGVVFTNRPESREDSGSDKEQENDSDRNDQVSNDNEEDQSEEDSHITENNNGEINVNTDQPEVLNTDEIKEPVSLNEKYFKEFSENENGEKEQEKEETHDLESKEITDDTDSDDAKDKNAVSLVEKFSNLRHDTPEDFDAKKQYDSGSDLDEFGRRRDRPRPSSSMYDYLPPLKPDPVIDDNDVNNCKIRLLRDAVTIREALFKNEGLELETSVELIISHNCDNRRWLRKLYRDEYLQSLLLDLRKTLPADVASVISYMMIPRCEFDAMHLWDALKGLHKDPEVLCEILCTRNNQEMKAITEAYFMRYDEELINHIEDETIGYFQRILMKLALGEREEDLPFTKAECAKEARALQALLNDVKGEILYKRLIDVFTRCSVNKLRVILSEYRKFKGHDLDKDIVTVLTGDFCRCIITLMQYIHNPPNYFVEKLHDTHFSGVDDDKGLCRIIISRTELDLEMIKQLFLLRYNMELFEYVNQACHGPLKGLVLRIILGTISMNSKIQILKFDDQWIQGDPYKQVLTGRNKNLRLQTIYNLPPLFPDEKQMKLQQDLTLPNVIELILRKTKVISRLFKILNMRKERLNQEATSSSDSAEELEKEPEQDPVEKDKDLEPAPLDSDEEEERAEKEAQRELRNGLKNISFADEVILLDEGDHKSVFHDVKFAAASRGILKNKDAEESDEDNREKVSEPEDDLGVSKPAGPKMTQLNGPVLDPTFQGREGRKGKKEKKRKLFRGTIKGVDMNLFNALKDAQALGKAMLQKNRNIEGILQFMATRNNAQRQLIIREFFRRYRRDLVDDLRILAPYHEEITLSLLLSNEIYASASLYAGIESNDHLVTIDVLIEILCTRHNDEISIIKRAFDGIFSLNFHEQISELTEGPFRDLLSVIADCQRDEEDIVNENLAKKDAQALYESVIKSRNMRDLNIFVEIFGTRTFSHIELVCDNFAKIARLDILEILDEVLEDEFFDGITAIICNVRDPAMYFCEKIYRAASSEVPDITTLIRCVVSRSEIDLKIIKHAFRQTYGRSLHNLIDKECDFKSKRILLDVVKK